MANPVAVLQDIFKFLAIDNVFCPDMSKKHNASQIPRNKTWHKFVNQPNIIKSIIKPFLPVHLRQNFKKTAKKNKLYKPQLSPEVRQLLLTEYQPDILQLQELIGRDLSKWLEC